MQLRLQGLRALLERALLLLRERDDADASRLEHDCRNLLSMIRLVEQAAERGVVRPEHAPNVLSSGRALIERVREYAERNRLRFLIVETPMPMSSSDILAEILEMKRGAQPPEEVLAIIQEQALRHDTQPCPPPDVETMPALPEDQETAPE